MNMPDQAEAMKLRTKQFAILIVSVVRSLPRTREGVTYLCSVVAHSKT
jgi:hypothetical protein